MERFLSKEQARHGRRAIIRELRRLDKTLERPENYRTFRAGMVLMAVYMVGTSVPVLEEITAQPPKFIDEILARLRKSHMLRGEILRVNWDHPTRGGWSVLFDAMSAAGDINRAANPKKVAARKKQARARTAQGLCRCGRVASSGLRTCEACRTSTAASQKRRKQPHTIGVFSPAVKPRRDSDDYYGPASGDRK